jgi:hypothetical protein
MPKSPKVPTTTLGKRLKKHQDELKTNGKKITNEHLLQLLGTSLPTLHKLLYEDTYVVKPKLSDKCDKFLAMDTTNIPDFIKEEEPTDNASFDELSKAIKLVTGLLEDSFIQGVMKATKKQRKAILDLL